VAVIDDPIGEITPTTLKGRRDRADGLGVGENRRCRRQENRARIEMRQPDDWRLISSQIRIDRETATPSVASAVREILPARQDHRLSPDDRDGSPDCAAKTPRPIPNN
jgi:hypothetical protein